MIHRDGNGGIPLSPRETIVLHLIAWGYTNKEIAARLGLSVKTVEAHKSNGMRKLSAPNRAALVRHAVDSGWLARETAPASQ
jgi:two-component system, NarL family, response regulator NreC